MESNQSVKYFKNISHNHENLGSLIDVKGARVGFIFKICSVVFPYVNNVKEIIYN